MTILCLTVDFINDLCHPDGRIARAAASVAANGVIENANRVLAWAREKNHAVAHVKVGFGPGYAQWPAASPLFGGAREAGALRLGEWGTKFCDALDVRETEPVIVKHRVSCFYGTDLEPLLRARKVERLILMGVSTDMAIQTTAREAHDRDYEVVIITDACCSAEAETHEASLKVLSRIAALRTAAEITA